jgi:hypothetical protein
VAWFSLKELGVLVRRHRADDSVIVSWYSARALSPPLFRQSFTRPSSSPSWLRARDNVGDAVAHRLVER